jgi:hypothetical protein
MRILSIDIGVHNMAFYIEEFDLCDIQKLECGKTSRYDLNGCPTPQWKELLNKVYNNGKKILLDRVDLSDKKGTLFDLKTFINLSNYLENNKKEINQVDIIVIEQQMKTNPMAQRLEQHCVSWFTFMYLDTKEIVIFPSRNKTQVLGAPKKVYNQNKEVWKKMTKHQRKKWACDEASFILTLRNDTDSLHFIFNINKSKRDDLSDVIVQLNAFKIKCFIDKKLR